MGIVAALHPPLISTKHLTLYVTGNLTPADTSTLQCIWQLLNVYVQTEEAFCCGHYGEEGNHGFHHS